MFSLCLVACEPQQPVVAVVVGGPIGFVLLLYTSPNKFDPYCGPRLHKMPRNESRIKGHCFKSGPVLSDVVTSQPLADPVKSALNAQQSDWLCDYAQQYQLGLTILRRHLND
ncbi:unnamed protein product [Nippostrongylus brasiliensis]|uniref:Lipoprotein n=1 Tax=Nippostrongylus brasiliensis TaxID=27835 RepID=A0A0N4XUV3_NIPBR|nr:unnamed protein product [Nippostrongylus brasiliensis]